MRIFLCVLVDEGRVKTVQIALYGAAAEVVYYVAFAARSRTLHHLTSASYVERHDVPVAFAELLKTDVASSLVCVGSEVDYRSVSVLRQLVCHDFVEAGELLLLCVGASHVERLTFLSHFNIVLLEYGLGCSVVD